MSRSCPDCPYGCGQRAGQISGQWGQRARRRLINEVKGCQLAGLSVYLSIPLSICIWTAREGLRGGLLRGKRGVRNARCPGVHTSGGAPRRGAGRPLSGAARGAHAHTQGGAHPRRYGHLDSRPLDLPNQPLQQGGRKAALTAQTLPGQSGTGVFGASSGIDRAHHSNADRRSPSTTQMQTSQRLIRSAAGHRTERRSTSPEGTPQ